MEWSIGCCCAPPPPPILFQWSRWLTRVGAVSPHSSLSDFSDTRWVAVSGNLLVEVEGQDIIGPVTELKMQPIRYTFGGHDSALYSNIGTRQSNVGPRDTCPPTSTDGHVLSIPIESLIPPNMLFIRWTGTGVGVTYNGYGSLLRAIGVSKNGTHVGIIDFGTSLLMTAAFNTDPQWKSHSAISAQAISITCVESDTIELDYYLHVIPADVSPETAYVNAPTGTSLTAMAALGSVQHSVIAPTAFTANPLKVNSIESRVDDATGHKVIFSDNGPAGLTELAFGSVPAGWTSAAIPSGVRLNKSDGTYIVEFGWMEEIPYLEIFNVSKISTYSRVRYRPIASGDYDAILVKGFSGSNTQEYGVWKYAELNPYTSRVVKVSSTSSGPWYTEAEIGSSAFDDYPQYVIIVPPTLTVDEYNSGSGTWPSPVNGYVFIEWWGPGGGGASGEAGGGNRAGSGGGGGGYGSAVVLVTDTDTIAYAVGAGGIGGTYDNDDATAGGTTTVDGGTYSATGGGKGLFGGGMAGGAGGVSSGGLVNIDGDDGTTNPTNIIGGAGGDGANGGAGGAGAVLGTSLAVDGSAPAAGGGGGGGKGTVGGGDTGGGAGGADRRVDGG